MSHGRWISSVMRALIDDPVSYGFFCFFVFFIFFFSFFFFRNGFRISPKHTCRTIPEGRKESVAAGSTGGMGGRVLRSGAEMGEVVVVVDDGMLLAACCK